MSLAKNFAELEVYQRSFSIQQRIFDVTGQFPREEAYALTDQVRRSSRSIGANIAEGWQKRKYPAHFKSKLTDADSELAETLHWLATAFCMRIHFRRYTFGIESKVSSRWPIIGRHA